MSIIALISLILLSVNGQERAGNQRYQPRQQPRPRGQMGFKWSRQYARGSGGFGGYKSNTQSPETKPTGYTQQGPGIGGLGAATPLNTETQDASSTTNDGSEPTLNIEGDDELPPPQIVIDNATEAQIEPFITTSDSIDGTEFQNVEMIENTMDQENMHQPPIMDCLYNKCQDPFNNCYNDEKCKEFMREWQEIQSLAPECLPKTETQTQEIEKIEIENTEFPMESTQEAAQVIECEYDELFWDTYNCGVQQYCYNDQLALVSSHQYILSPSNYRVQPNVTGTSKSSFNYTLLLVAVTSGISAVILVEVLRRLYTGLKDKCKCKCKCEYECLSLRYLKNKWEQIRGYKYEKTHADIDAIEEEEDEEMYGRDNETSTTNTNIGVTYNGPINDDSDISDDEELQKKCTSSKAMSLDQQTDEDGDIVTDNEDLIVHSDQFQKSDEEEIIANNDEEKEKEEEEEKVIQQPVQQL